MSSLLSISCVIEDDDFPFRVGIRTDGDVFDLHKRVQSERGLDLDTLQGVSPYKLELWKLQDTNALDIKPRDTLLERIELLGPGLSDFAERLDPTEGVSNIFPTQPSMDHIQIVVKITARGVAKRFREEDEPEAVKRLKLEIGRASPSTLAFPNEFQKITGPNHAIGCNRPFEATTIPLVLLHQAFGLFQDRCLQRPSGTAMACLNELAPAACKWYGSEAERRETILNVLSEHLQLAFHPKDGNLIVMPFAARACKNEAILYYSDYLKHALDRPQHFYNFDTRFPCILLVNTGPHFAFYGALWDGERVRVEPLIPPLDLATHWMESKRRADIASSLDALVLAVNSIRAHYKEIEAEAHATPAPKAYDQPLQKSRKFPFVTSYIDGGGGGQEISLTYVERLDEQKLIFSAFMNGDQRDGECIVKFTQRYSEAAHLCLASYCNSAPALRHCIRVSSTWMAVVMDRSRYTTLYCLRLTDPDQQERVRRKVGETLQVLHDAGFVHGDIRDTNILVDRESLESTSTGDGAVRIHFVDFDWAGRVGEARYPGDVNGITVRRPEGIEGGEVITVEHDKAMLSY